MYTGVRAMMHDHAAHVLLLLWALVLGGCFGLHEGSDGGDAGVEPGVDGGGVDSGAGAECPRVGATILCGRYCDTPACGGGLCNSLYDTCVGDDHRGGNRCGEGEDGYFEQFCLGGSVCIMNDRGQQCVDPEFCHWIRERDEPEYTSAICRYSDGTTFVDGPLEGECGSGADPDLPFCGGACGDTCPAVSSSPSLWGPGCFGLSEHRAFGVCSPNPNPPCEERNADRLLAECALDLSLLSGVWMPSCACMRLAQEPGGALPDRGEPVALQSCLAYREIYPDQVSCLDGEWNEL